MRSDSFPSVFRTFKNLIYDKILNKVIMKKKTKKKLIIGSSILAAIGTGFVIYRCITSKGKVKSGEIAIIGDFSDGCITGWNDRLADHVILASHNLNSESARFLSQIEFWNLIEEDEFYEIPNGQEIEKTIRYKHGFLKRIITGFEYFSCVLKFISKKDTSKGDSDFVEKMLTNLKGIDFSDLKLVWPSGK